MTDMSFESVPAWHRLDVAQAAAGQATNPVAGLDAAEAARRLARHGENRLAVKPPRSKWLALLDQFRSLLILVLIGAAALAGAIGDLKDAVVILVVVAFNALL